MSTIGYSPWLDAGRYGQGLADTLGQILLSIPQIRQQNARQQFEMDRQGTLDLQQQQLFPSQLQLAQGAVPAQSARTAQELAMAKYYEQLPGIRQTEANARVDLSQTKNRMAMMMHEAATKANARLVAEKQRTAGQNKMSYIPRTEYQPAGSFNPMSGQFNPIDVVPQQQQEPLAGVQQDPRTISGFLYHPIDNTLTGLGDLLKMFTGGGQQQQMSPQARPQPVQVHSQQEYDMLPPGTPYIDSQGTQGVKR